MCRRHNPSSLCLHRRSQAKSRQPPCPWRDVSVQSLLMPSVRSNISAKFSCKPGSRWMNEPFSALLDRPDLAKRLSPGLCALAAVLALAGCDRRSESNPGSTPAAIGSGSTSNGRSDAGTSGSGVEVRTPAAPDTRSGGSSGSAGVAPIPDTSGAPSSGSTGSGSSEVRPGQVGGGVTTGSSGAAASQSGGASSGAATQTTTNGGVPASAMGGAGTTSGAPQSSTGGR